jgi:hypothetical protein
MKVEIITESEYVSKSSLSYLENQAKATYMEKLSLNGGQTSGDTNVDNNYKSKSQTSVHYYGGKSGLISNRSDFQNWVNSIEENPWIFGGKLTPIMNFLPNVTNRAALKTAYQVKLDKAFLDELSMSLTYLKKNPAIDSEMITNLSREVETLKKEVIPSHLAVKKLGDTIEKLCDTKLVAGKN